MVELSPLARRTLSLRPRWVIAKKKQPVLLQIAVAIVAAATVVYTASAVRPIFVGRAPFARQLVAAEAARAARDSVARAQAEAALPGWLRSTDPAIASEHFKRDREAFALDLIRTGLVGPIRARSLADVAVTESYRQKIPPALVLGVMLTENDQLKSTARSRVGAVGLMQVYGRAWRSALGRKYGTNLRDDATNLKWGIHILRYMAQQVPDSASAETGWRKALLGYNGCVRGTNTPDCKRYPDVVRREVLRSARASCPNSDFDRCVVEPLNVAMRGQNAGE